MNKPVKVQNNGEDTIVNPGDYIIADLNGVVCLPANLADKAISLIPPQVKADELIAEELKSGMLFTDASKKHRTMLSPT